MPAADAPAAVTQMQEFQLELDLRGMNCPLPVLHTKKALAQLASGQRVRVVTTDPGSEIDLPVLVEVNGHKLLSFAAESNQFVFLIEKA